MAEKLKKDCTHSRGFYKFKLPYLAMPARTIIRDDQDRPKAERFSDPMMTTRE